MMKLFFLLLVLLGGASYFFKQNKDSTQNPEVISNPVYAEIRWNMESGGRSFDSITFVKAVDEADCQKLSKATVEGVETTQESKDSFRGQKMKLKSSECKTALAPRYAALFSNEPTSLTYISIARGDKREREARIIHWGASVQEADDVCTLTSQFQKGHKGLVSCVRSVRP